MSRTAKVGVGLSVAWSLLCALGGPVVFVVLAAAPLAVGWSVWWAKQHPRLPAPQRSLEPTPNFMAKALLYGLGKKEPPFDKWRPPHLALTESHADVIRLISATYQAYLFWIYVVDRRGHAIANETIDEFLHLLASIDRDMSEVFRSRIQLFHQNAQLLNDGQPEATELPRLLENRVASLSDDADDSDSPNARDIAACLAYSRLSAQAAFPSLIQAIHTSPD